jgi:hypothetical protein
MLFLRFSASWVSVMAAHYAGGEVDRPRLPAFLSNPVHPVNPVESILAFGVAFGGDMSPCL